MMMLWVDDEDKIYTIKDLYDQAFSISTPLLSEFPGDFWGDYITYHEYFDKLFAKKYKSFFPYDQDYEDGVAVALIEFQTSVYALLLANSKKYTELYRVHTIEDNTAYSLTNNLDVTETTTRTVDTDRTMTKGQETITDDGATQYGQQIVNKDISNEYGAQTNTITDTTSAYNSSDYSPKDQTTESFGTHTDTINDDTTYGTHTDNIDNTRTISARSDTDNEDVEESISIHRVGNQGVSTVDDILKGHVLNWNDDLFNFYNVVFSDIAKELLRGC